MNGMKTVAPTVFPVPVAACGIEGMRRTVEMTDGVSIMVETRALLGNIVLIEDREVSNGVVTSIRATASAVSKTTGERAGRLA